MNANAEKTVIIFTCTQVITSTYTQKRTNLDTHENGKKTDFTLSETRRRILSFFKKNEGFCPFPAVRQKMADRSLWDERRFHPPSDHDKKGMTSRSRSWPRRLARRATMRTRCMDPLSSASESGGREEPRDPRGQAMQGFNLQRLVSRGRREVVPKGRVPETERSPTPTPGGRAEFQHLAFWDGAKANISARTRCMVLQPHASPGKGSAA